eukprot:gb/GECG01007074.1/.p1 GENE.gb/GECG01007074.1/~~gb/GECG01007074.1/.p1  ORF type:complete len:110 (+),score=15.30 gb/GECG01007074.1/:1-330(+)
MGERYEVVWKRHNSGNAEPSKSLKSGSASHILPNKVPVQAKPKVAAALSPEKKKSESVRSIKREVESTTTPLTEPKTSSVNLESSDYQQVKRERIGNTATVRSLSLRTE